MFLKEIREQNKRVFIFGINKSSISLMKLLSRNKIKVLIWDNNVKLVEKFKETVGAQESYIEICNVDECNFDRISYFVIGKDILLEAEELNNLLSRLDKIKDKVFIDIEFFYKLFPNNTYCGIIGSAGKEVTSSLMWHIFSDAKVNNLKLSSKDDDVDGNSIISLENTFCSVVVPFYKINYLKELQFDMIALLNIEEAIRTGHTKKLREYLDYNKTILSKQSEYSSLVVNVDDKILKEFYNELQEDKIFKGKLIGISVDKLLSDGVSFVNGTIYNYYNGTNESYDVPENNSLKGDLNKLSILTSFACAFDYGLKAEAIIESIASFKGVKNYLEYVGQVENVKYINNLGANSLSMLMSPFDTYDNIRAIFVVNGKQFEAVDIKKYNTKVEKSYVVDLHGLLDNADFEDKSKKAKKFNSLADAFEAVKMDIEEEDKSKQITVLLSPIIASEFNSIYYNQYGHEFYSLVNEEK